MKNFLIWGDSITYGHGDADGGWVGRLRKTVWKDSLVYNLGISGILQKIFWKEEVLINQEKGMMSQHKI